MTDEILKRKLNEKRAQGATEDQLASYERGWRQIDAARKRNDRNEKTETRRTAGNAAAGNRTGGGN